MINLSQIINSAKEHVSYATQEITHFIEKTTTLKIQHVTTAIFLGLLAGTWYYAAAYHASSLIATSIMFGSAVGLAFLFLAAVVAFFKQVRTA